MAQITLTNNNGQTVKIDGEIQVISSILAGLNFTQPEENPAPSTINPIEQKALSFIDFMSQELDKFIVGGKFFVSELNRLRLNKNNDYNTLRIVYGDLLDKVHPDYVRQYRVLTTASAVWRYTFSPKANHSRLKNQILRDTGCEDCGQFASAMIERMKKEGLWV
jgi:hypothetical protein